MKEYRIEIWTKHVVVRKGKDMASLASSVKRELEFKNIAPDQHAFLHSIEDISQTQATEISQKHPQD